MVEPERDVARLTELEAGLAGEVAGFCGCERRAQRLAELGMTPGALLDVVRATPGQPMLVRVRRTLLAIDRDSANEVLVNVVDSHRHCRRRGKRRRFGFHRRRRQG